MEYEERVMMAMRKRIRVVIVDDSRTMQAILDQTLSMQLGFEVVGVASDGASAIPMIRDLRPDLVTIDLHMPYIDGGQLLEAIRNFPGLVKVVISSHASSSLEMGATLEKLGADACIGKDVMSRDRATFCRTLRSTVARHRTAAPAPLKAAEAHRAVQNGQAAAINRPSSRHPVPCDEAKRLQLVDRLKLANDDVDHRLDLLTAHLTRTTSFSASVITFLDDQWAWIKSGRGMQRGRVGREESICSYTICSDEPLILYDARRDARFRDFALVKSGEVRAYVGCPIIASSGVRLGALCLLDSTPRNVSAAEIANACSIARIAAQLIETTQVCVRNAA